MAEKKSDKLAKVPAGGAAEALAIPVGLVGDLRTGDEAMESILAEIAAAGSIDEALAGGIVHGLQEYDGKVLTFLDFHYQPSEFDATGWPYTVARCVTGDGEQVTVTCGAKRVTALLALARQKNQLPFAAGVQVTEFDDEATGERRKVVTLVAP